MENDNGKQYFEIPGVVSNEPFQDLSTDTQNDMTTTINNMLSGYTDEDKSQIMDKLVQLEKTNKKNFRRILPQGLMPLYLSPLDPETEVLQVATWNQYSDVGPYADFDDSYCRPDTANKNNYVYPRRNPENQEIELSSCNTLINNDIKEMTDLNQYMSSFNDLSKAKLLELNGNDINSSLTFKKEIDKRLTEYNTLQEQYIQLTNLLQTNIDLINKRKKIIDDQSGDLETSENDYNIKREIVADDMENTRDRVKQLGRAHLILKTLGVVLILIAVGLILLIDIGKVL